MRITDVETITFKTTKQAIAKVYTDEGIVGVGSISSHPQVAKAIIEAEPTPTPTLTPIMNFVRVAQKSFFVVWWGLREQASKQP